MGLTANSVFKRVPIRFSLESLDTLLADCPRHDFQIRLWDGSSWGSREQPRFVIVLKEPNALRQMLHSPSELSLGECYIFDDLDIEGDIEAAIEVGDFLLARGESIQPSRSGLAWVMHMLPARQPHTSAQRTDLLRGPVHSRRRDQQAISYHYDLPPEFFALWLDRRQLYSCAYFPREECDLDTAQRCKLDYICDKLRLQKSERLLDIGCGWGGLLVHAAACYGVQAVGITLSVRQAEVARRRIRDAGLNDRCRVEVCDYRDLELDASFDKIVSVGMFEHVGEAQLPEYFSHVWRLLRPGGAFLNSGIADSATYVRHGPSFIDHYVFPDGELVPISRALRAAEKSGFEVRDAESMREHYALTLRHWVHRLEANSEQAKRLTDETTYRIWRLYMAASAHAFRTARLNLYQVLLVKPANGKSGLPLTRADWYS
jgi:cyclopropane-fatty-acyl-phospholipid synthase